ncbi:uncharacterized protein [Triticum aestivum]|nr:uncharacterized protein LOC123160105 [Triticum aestivum]XP_044433860.1 uncharacterized protein LOC123160105 [Triticum aestivum]
MPLYDCMLMVKPMVTKEAIAELVARVAGRAYQRNGIVTELKSFGKVHLGYGIRKLDDRHFQCIPFNIRVDFNKLCGNAIYFADDMGCTFLMDVHKRKDRTIIYGDEWKQYIAQNNLIGGEYISFSLKGDVNRLRTMYFYNNDDGDDNRDHDDSQDQQDDRDDQDDEDEEDDDDGPLSSAIFCERIGKLTRDETMNITVMLPSSVAFMRKPFVHRLTKTNIVKKVMKLPIKMFF